LRTAPHGLAAVSGAPLGKGGKVSCAALAVWACSSLLPKAFPRSRPAVPVRSSLDDRHSGSHLDDEMLTVAGQPRNRAGFPCHPTREIALDRWAVNERPARLAWRAMSVLVPLTRAALREIDRRATEEYGIPSAVLMENAGRGAAEWVLRSWPNASPAVPARSPSQATVRDSSDASVGSAAPSLKERRVAIFCGPGNNGGDGGVVARHLANAGLHVDVLSTEAAATLRGDAALQRHIVERMKLALHDVATEEGLERARAVIESADVIVDGLLGTGFEGEVRPKIARVIRRINAVRAQRSCFVVALDLPSGLECDRGRPADPTVVADLTIAFVAAKPGFDNALARAVLGRVVVVPIGAPMELIERVARSAAT
jgi:NAD(P)H-hydrate epimerase